MVQEIHPDQSCSGTGTEDAWRGSDLRTVVQGTTSPHRLCAPTGIGGLGFPTHALDVVMMGRYGHLGWFRRPGKKERDLAAHCLEQVGMGDYMYRQISQLSGGQQQRVFLARALVQDADLYFMDEPFAGVDATTEKAIISLLEQLKKQGKTVLVVHHDLATVEEYFDHVLLLNGRLVAGGPTSEVFVPDTLQETYGGRIAMIGSRTEKGQV